VGCSPRAARRVLITMAKEGSTIGGIMGRLRRPSRWTQYGVPLEAVRQQFSHMRFERWVTDQPGHPHSKERGRLHLRWMASVLPGYKEANSGRGGGVWASGCDPARDDAI